MERVRKYTARAPSDLADVNGKAWEFFFQHDAGWGAVKQPSRQEDGGFPHSEIWMRQIWPPFSLKAVPAGSCNPMNTDFAEIP